MFFLLLPFCILFISHCKTHRTLFWKVLYNLGFIIILLLSSRCYISQHKTSAATPFSEPVRPQLPTCDAVMRDWSRRAVRSEEETLAGAPRWSLIATFLSRSARSALPAWGERFPAHTHKDTPLKWRPSFCYRSTSRLLLNIQNYKLHPDLTAGLHVWPGSTEQHPPRSSLCWLPKGSGQVAKLGLRLLFGLLLLVPPPLFLPSSPSLHPRWSCSPPATQRNNTDVNVCWREEKGQKCNGKGFWTLELVCKSMLLAVFCCL